MTIINSVKSVDGLEAKTQMSIIKIFWSDIAVFGTDLVGAKMLRLLEIILTLEDFGPSEKDPGVRIVIFRNDLHPMEEDISGKADDRPVVASCCAAAGAVIINVRKTLEFAFTDVINNPDVNVLSSYHYNMLMNIAHELLHMDFMTRFPGKPVDDVRERLDEIRAKRIVMDAAKVFDLEPDHYTAIPALAELDAVLVGEQWEKQRHMIKHNLYYDLEPTEKEHGLQLWSFKQFCQLLSGDNMADPAWDSALNKAQKETVQREKAAVAATQAPPTAVVVEQVWDAPPVVGNIADYPVETAPAGYDAAAMEAMEAMNNMGMVPSAEESYAGVEVEPQVMTTAPAAPVAMGNAFPVHTPATVVPAVETPAPGIVLPSSATDAIQEFYMNCYRHIFTNCQRMLNSDVGFARPEAVAEIPIQLSEEQRKYIVAYDGMDQFGKFIGNSPVNNGQVRGYIMKNTKIPAYRVYIKAGETVECRLLLPQNPAKVVNGQYTAPAMEARQGVAIMYVMQSNDTTKTGKNRFLFKIKNGVIEKC